MTDIVAIAVFLVGCILPLLGSAMVPDRSQRLGAAAFSAIGIAITLGIAWNGSTPFHAGLAVGFVLASIKLLTGLRFL